MKKLAQMLLAFLFMNGIALFLLLLAVRLSGLSGATLKEQLRTAGFYDVVINYVNQSVDTNNQIDINQVQGAGAVSQLIKSQLTSQYLQSKLEKFIDEGEAYVTGQRATAPTLSFNDFKEKLFGSDNPQLSDKINQTKSDAQAFNPETATESDSSLPGGIDFSQKDFTVRADKPLAYLRSAYYWFALTLYLSAAITVLSFGLIVYLSPTRKDRFKAVANLLLSTDLLVFLPFVILAKANDTIGNVVLIRYPQYAQLGKSIFVGFFAPLLNEYNHLQNITIVSFLVVAIVCYVEYYVLKHLEADHLTITAPPPPPQLVVPPPPKK